MKSIKSLVGPLVGGIGILAGFGMMLVGCSDDNSNKSAAKTPTAEEIAACCGNDNGSKAYKECVENYKGSSDSQICMAHDIDQPDVYGPPPSEINDTQPTAEEIKKCCGEDNGSDEYKECVENYTGSSDSKVCMVHDIDQPDVYGPPPSEINDPEPTEEEIKECCGDEDESVKYKKCVEELTKSGNCDINEASDPTYGMPDIPPDEQPDA